MQNSTDRKKRAPIICAVVIIGLLAVFLATILFPLVGASYGEWIALGFLAVYGLVIVAVIVGVLAALRQRLKEIESGEEEDARKY